jgi:hypothetical protein
MIRMFPLLIDSTISQNIIPGICKVLERYLIVYKLDDLIALDKFGGGVGSMITSSMGNILSHTVTGAIPGLKRGNTNESIVLEDALDDKLQSMHKNNLKDKKKDEKSTETVQVRIDSHSIESSLSLEPTWITFQSRVGTTLLGVKVIPIPIKNPQAYISQLMEDKGLKTFERIVLSTGNSIIRAFRSIMRNALKRPLRALGVTFPEISGDPFDDIVLGKSKFGQNTMLLLNYANIKDDSVFMDSGGLDKLFALGWSSVLVADEVAKKLIFCMKEFYGHCSFVPYSFIYHAMGRDAMSAYENLESAKKSMSPFQQTKVDASKFFGESLIRKNMEKYIGLGLPCLKEDCK